MTKYFIFIPLFATILTLAQSSASPDTGEDKKQVKSAFISLSAKDQQEMMSRAEVFNSKYSPDKVPTIDVVADLEKDCGLKYERSSQQIQWPQVNCHFHPDLTQSMGGGSSKFLCDFDEKDKLKVRYSPKKNPYEGESEVVETIIAAALGRLVGFSAKRDCPADLTCVNCPNSDPWNNKSSHKKSDHSSLPGKEGLNVHFPFTAIEYNLKAFHISTQTSNNAPNGVHWPELKIVAKDLSPSEQRRMLIEREVMMLWEHFLMNPDAGHFNNRLSCPQKSVVTTKATSGELQVNCQRPEVYVHDYGHSFYEHFQFDKYIQFPVLISNTKKGGCFGVMTKENIRSIRNNTPLLKDDSAFLLGARISSEARDELVRRLKLVTDQQWTDLYLIGRVEKAQQEANLPAISIQAWIAGMKQKIRSMEEAQCLPFDEGSSALGIRN